jgi:hypothetical protein
MRRLGIPPDHQHQDISGIWPAGPQREPITKSLDNAA